MIKNTKTKMKNTKRACTKKVAVPQIRKITEVAFVKSDYKLGLSVFEEKLNKAITDGWQPYNVPFITDGKFENSFVQELVKYEDK